MMNKIDLSRFQTIAAQEIAALDLIRAGFAGGSNS